MAPKPAGKKKKKTKEELEEERRQAEEAARLAEEGKHAWGSASMHPASMRCHGTQPMPCQTAMQALHMHVDPPQNAVGLRRKSVSAWLSWRGSGRSCCPCC